jgi:hypothetical protein
MFSVGIWSRGKPHEINIELKYLGSALVSYNAGLGAHMMWCKFLCAFLYSVMLLYQVHIIYCDETMRVIDILGKLDIIYCNEIMGFVRHLSKFCFCTLIVEQWNLVILKLLGPN